MPETTTAPLPSFALDEMEARLRRRFGSDYDDVNASAETMAQIREAARHEQALAREAVEAAAQIARVAMGSGTRPYLVAALASEHPTILAQVARAGAQAIMSKAEAYAGPQHARCANPSDQTRHLAHDGRFTCASVAAASLLALQPVI